MAVDSMLKATTPEPIGKPGGPGLFRIKGLQLPPYIQHVRNELMKHGLPESAATERAIGIVEDWKNGHMPGSTKPVHPDTQAAAALAWTQWLAARALAKATPNKGRSKHLSNGARVTVDLAFNPSQVRAPAGGPTGGEWAAQGGTAPGDSSTPQGRAWSKKQIGTYPPGMVKPADKKKWDNWFRFFAMTPEQQKAFLDSAKHKKPPKPKGAPKGPRKKHLSIGGTVSIDLAVPSNLRQAARDKAKAQGATLPGTTSYPTQTRALFDKAVEAVGRGGADHDRIRAYIIRRAKKMGWPVPDNWNPDGSLKSTSMSTSARPSVNLAGYGRTVTSQDGPDMTAIDTSKKGMGVVISHVRAAAPKGHGMRVPRGTSATQLGKLHRALHRKGAGHSHSGGSK